MTAEGVERAVVGEVVRVLTDPIAVEKYASEVERRVAEADSGRPEERKRWEEDTRAAQKKLLAYRQQIDEHGHSASVAKWIAEEEAKEARARAELAKLDETKPRVIPARKIVEAWLANAANLLQTDPVRSRAVLQQVNVDATAKPIARGRYELRFRVLPVGVLVEIGVPTPSSFDMGSRGAKGGT